MKRKLIPIVAILLVSLLVRVAYLFDYHEVWWDSAVYIGMGEYLFSFGQLGLWEHIRPVAWPVVLGTMWRLKFDVLLAGRVLQLLFGIGIIYLTYKIGERVFHTRAGIFAAAMLSFSSVFFLLGFRLYTEVPATFLLLLSIWLALRKKLFWSGLVLGISALTKFPMLIFGAGFLVYLVYAKPKALLRFGSGALLALIPFFVFNFFMYGSYLLPFIDARETIHRVLGCNYLYYKPWYFYFQGVFRENVLYALAPLGIVVSLRKFNKEKLLVLLSLVVPFIYFLQLHCRDQRYLVLFVPFMAVYSGVFGYSVTKELKKTVFYAVVLAILLVSAWQGLAFYQANEPREGLAVREDYYRFLENKPVSGEVWVSNPIVGLYADTKIHKIYYPVYDYNLARDFQDYVRLHSENISYVFLDSCGGGMICRREDSQCINQTNSLVGLLNEEFGLVYDEQYQGCDYYVFKAI